MYLCGLEFEVFEVTLRFVTTMRVCGFIGYMYQGF